MDLIVIMFSLVIIALIGLALLVLCLWAENAQIRAETDKIKQELDSARKARVARQIQAQIDGIERGEE